MMKIGVGIITFNRISYLKDCVEALRKTDAPYQLVVAEDGGSDNTVSWCREQGIDVVTGSNHGVGYNKNRALHALFVTYGCDVVILLEDDTRVQSPDWLAVWAEATAEWGHTNYMAPHRDYVISGSGSNIHDPIIARAVLGPITGTSRVAFEAVGYLDSRFRGYGFEHAEWTNRMIRAGFGGFIANDELRYKCLSYGIDYLQQLSFRDEDQVKKNRSIYAALMADKSIYREPWRDDTQKAEFLGQFGGMGHATESKKEVSMKLEISPSRRRKSDGFSWAFSNPEADYVMSKDLTIPLPDRSVDAFYLHGTLPRLASPKLLLKEINRLSKDGATVEIWSPHGFSNESFLIDDVNHLNEVFWEHICITFRDSFLGLFSGSRWQLDEFRYVVPYERYQHARSAGIPLDFAIRYLKGFVREFGQKIIVRHDRDAPVVAPKRFYQFALGGSRYTLDNNQADRATGIPIQLLEGGISDKYLSDKAGSWNEQYADGAWNRLRNMREFAHYGSVAAYVNARRQSVSVLDLGCGEGILFNFMNAKIIANYTGVDISVVALEGARSNIANSADPHTRCRLICAPAEVYSPETDEKFDFIILNEVLHYCNDPKSLLEKLRPHLSLDGVMIVSWFRRQNDPLLAKEMEMWNVLEAEKWEIIDVASVQNIKHNLQWQLRVVR